MSYLEQHPEYIAHVSCDEVPFPTAINIDLTTYCNLHCIMCPKSSGIARTPANRHMSESILQRIIDEVVPQVFRIDLVGDGEILMAPGLLKKVLEAAERQQILVNASTNGVLLTPQLSDMLVQLKLHDLNISLDAAEPEMYRIIRGGDLHKVLDNISTLNRIKSDHQSPYPILQFSMVGMKRNIHQLPDLVQLALHYQAQSVMLQAMGEFDIVEDESIYLRDKVSGRKWLEKAAEFAEGTGVTISLWPKDQLSGQDTSPAVNPDHQTAKIRLKDCDFPWDVPYFATDGSVRPCCAMPPMGNLNESSFIDIWSGQNYSRLRARMKSINPPAECVTCPGRGWYEPSEVASELIPGSHDRQFGTGWFELETYKGEHYRWARENAVFFIGGQGPGILEIEIHTVWDIGTTQQIDIQVDNEKTITASFNYGERRMVRVAVHNSKSFHCVRLRGNGWRPVRTVPGERDPRSLSVMFYGARMLSMKNGVTFTDPDAPTLRGWVIHNSPKSGATEQQLISLYWDVPAGFESGMRQFFHVFPEVHRMRHVKMAGHEMLRRIKPIKRFQLDLDFPKPLHHNEIMLQTITLKVPDGWTPGHYAIYTGLVDKRGHRVTPCETNLDIYRSSVFLSDMEII